MTIVQILALAFLGGSTAVAAASIAYATKSETTWTDPAWGWFRGLISSTWGWHYLPRVRDITLTTESDRVRAQLREVWADEDAEYRDAYHRNNLARGLPGGLDKVRSDRKKQLAERAKQLKEIREFALGALVAWLVCGVALVPVVAGSFFLKLQAAREFMTGSQNLQAFYLTIVGLPPIRLTAVEIVCVALVLFELVFGVTLQLAGERLHQAKAGTHDEPTGRWQFLRVVSVLGIIAMLGLEGTLGFFRGQLETGGDIFGTAWLVVLSVLVPLLAVVVAYILKGELKNALGFAGWIVRRFGFVGLGLAVLALGLVAKGVTLAACLPILVAILGLNLLLKSGEFVKGLGYAAIGALDNYVEKRAEAKAKAAERAPTQKAADPEEDDQAAVTTVEVPPPGVHVLPPDPSRTDPMARGTGSGGRRSTAPTKRTN
jgi:hypothetical protein